MNKIRTALIFLLAAAGSLAAQDAAITNQPQLSPAEQAVAQARQAIEKSPNQADGYNALALALARRAREISDVSYYTQADEAIQKSLAVAPKNFGAEKAHVWILLGKHEFPAARDAARELNKRVPDDVLVYGFIADANTELGNYDEAEKAVNWMLKLRAGNIPGLTRAAYLRELFGMTDGAYDLMKMALEATPVMSTEDRAWILTQMAHLRLSQGRTAEAEKLLDQALALFPQYHYALANLAKVRLEQKKNDEAVSLLQQRYDHASHAENLYDLAEALELSGKKREAAEAFTEFEKKSLTESQRADNSNRELIFYYADHANQPAKALEVAQREFARRHDVFTLDAYAWALHVNGRDAEARKAIEQALAVGIHDARLLAHAGKIALELGDRTDAERYLKQSVDLHAPGSDYARQLLASLGSTGRH
jgi:tetratricopeptide (TPR) repeat protein